MRQHICKYMLQTLQTLNHMKDNGLKTIYFNIESFLRGQTSESQGFLAGCLRKNQFEMEAMGGGSKVRD